MLHRIKQHPLPISAEFDHCLVLTYAVPGGVLGADDRARAEPRPARSVRLRRGRARPDTPTPASLPTGLGRYELLSRGLPSSDPLREARRRLPPRSADSAERHRQAPDGASGKRADRLPLPAVADRSRGVRGWVAGPSAEPRRPRGARCRRRPLVETSTPSGGLTFRECRRGPPLLGPAPAYLRLRSRDSIDDRRPREPLGVEAGARGGRRCGLSLRRRDRRRGGAGERLFIYTASPTPGSRASGIGWRARRSSMRSLESGTEISGVGQIVRFNWPYYAVGLGGCLVGVMAVRRLELPAVAELCLVALVALGLFWTLGSLFASWWVYDLAAVLDLDWLDDLLGHTPRSWVNVHAGLDQTTEALIRRTGSQPVLVIDLYDPARTNEPSIVRARALRRVREDTVNASPDRLPLREGGLDAAFLPLRGARAARSRRASLALPRTPARSRRRRSTDRGRAPPRPCPTGSRSDRAFVTSSAAAAGCGSRASPGGS